ncbi:MAG TPA: hypothetical protein VHZ55_16945 [Bryobacteraceae bacterium]|nr:hypothetical protein [Bryobacteraceae bacterium]
MKRFLVLFFIDLSTRRVEIAGIASDTNEFRSLLESIGVTSVKLPPQSPNLNGYADRFVRSIKESCLERLILFRENSLHTASREFLAHYKYAS